MADRLRIWKDDNSLIWDDIANVSTALNWDNVAFVDVTNGDDSTGTVGRADLPYATASAAETAASSGQTVWFRAGTHTANLLGKDGVYYYIDQGAVLEGNTGGGWIFSDNGKGAITIHVSGPGQLKANASSFLEMRNASTFYMFPEDWYKTSTTPSNECTEVASGTLYAGFKHFLSEVSNWYHFQTASGGSNPKIYVTGEYAETKSLTGYPRYGGEVHVRINHMVKNPGATNDGVFKARRSGVLYAEVNTLEVEAGTTSQGNILWVENQSGSSPPAHVYFEGTVINKSDAEICRVEDGGDMTVKNSLLINDSSGADRPVIRFQNSSNGGLLVLDNVTMINERTGATAHGITANISSPASTSNLDMKNVTIQLHSTAVGAGAKAFSDSSSMNYRALSDIYSNGAWDGTNLVSVTAAFVDSQIKSG